MNCLISIARMVSCFLIVAAVSAGAAFSQPAKKPALIVIGGSYSNGNLPLDAQLNGVWGGLNIGLGSYLDLGAALARDPLLPGYVINEGEAGSSTVAHHDCSLAGGTVCGAARWKSYDEQLDRALRRVSIPAMPGAYNAKYVIITLSNDCLHSNAFGVPEVQATSCSLAQINQYIDRLVALGLRVLGLGMIPVFDLYPDYGDIDLQKAGAGFAWIMDEATYNLMRDLHRARLSTELPGAVVLDMWRRFEDRGDGLHPDDKTVTSAAAMIARYIVTH